EEALHNLAIFVSSEDPKTFDDAQKLDVWKKAMDQEIDAIEKNNTWEFTDLPAGVGCKRLQSAAWN
ncbi:copia-type polyprotein, partial [Trifolium medium]|nr:copia-type polyprotein [Trifolium medium]